MSRDNGGTHGETRSSALWGTGNRGGDSRSNALWGKGGRGFVAILTVLFVAAIPLAGATGKKDANTPATLTINPGATLRFAGSTGLFVGTSTARGALVAAGTTAQPILFTTNNATPAPGQWYAVYFDTMSVDAIDLLDHVIVEYGGGGYSANVRVVTSSPTIRNSTIRNSSVYGIYSTSGSPTIQGNTFSANANFDAYVSSASNARRISSASSVWSNLWASSVWAQCGRSTLSHSRAGCKTRSATPRPPSSQKCSAAMTSTPRS